MNNLCVTILIFSSLISFSAHSEELHIKMNDADVSLLSDHGKWNYEIRVNDKSVLKEDGQILSFMFNERSDSYLWGNGKYLIIQVTTGGSGCPAFFRILGPNKTQNSLTKEFGTCSDTPNITDNGSGLILSFPTRETNVNRVWKYADGVLSE